MIKHILPSFSITKYSQMVLALVLSGQKTHEFEESVQYMKTPISEDPIFP